MNGKCNFEITWPLHGKGPGRPLPADPDQEVRRYAPPQQTLADLPRRTDIAARPSVESAHAFNHSLPASAPEWMHAARALADALEGIVARGQVSAAEHSAVARAWAAWSLGGVNEQQILHVAHLVSRAHQAIRNVSLKKQDLNAALYSAAEVLRANLPASVRTRIPVERVAFVMRVLYNEADPWVGVVEGTADILGWKHYARVHAASVIRSVLENRESNAE